MKIEVNITILALLAIIPSFLVFLAMTVKTKVLDKQIKNLENENLISNDTILELEKEIVIARKTQTQENQLINIADYKARQTY